MSKLIGYDGKEYDSPIEWNSANIRWEREIAQKESLERQEKLIEHQNELLEKKIEDQRRLVEEQMENDEWIEYERQEHDREMRILSLCDEIGISEKLISNYINYVLSSTKMSKEAQIEYDKLCNDIDKFNEENESINEEKKNNYLSHKRTLTEIKQFHFAFLDKCDDSEILSLCKKRTVCLKEITVWFLVGFIFMFIMIPITVSVNGGYIFLLYIFSICPMIIFLVKAFRYIAIKNAIKEVCDRKINELDNEFQKNKNIEESKDNDELLQLTKKKSLLLENCINKKLEDFYKFRVKHYNSKLEKFLIDYDFEEKVKSNNDLKIDYKVVTKSIASGNGDIDDYVEYFTEVIRK